MARINIDDNLYRDTRFCDLIILAGGKTMALGLLIEAWSVAQQQCSLLNPRALIPMDVWTEQRCSDHLITVKLAVIEGDMVYMRGSESQFTWLLQRLTSGAKGGKAKVANAQKKALAVARRSLTGRLAGSSGAYPLTPTLTSSSSKKKNNTYAQTEFERAYLKFPRKEGKARGMRIAEREVKTPEDLSNLEISIQRYADHCRVNKIDYKFIKHFGTFMAEWRDWLEPDHAKPPTTDHSNKAL